MSISLRVPLYALAVLAAPICFITPAAMGAVLQAQIPPGISQSLNALAEQPATHTGVIFDRSMMQVAQSLLQQGGLDPDRAAAALTSISFDTYRFKEPAFYTPETMVSILERFHRAGWKHLVNGNQSTANTAQPQTMITDVWLRFSGTDITQVTVLTRGTMQMNVIQLSGELRPLDLLHLSGHFGIPRVDPNAVMVPAPDGR